MANRAIRVGRLLEWLGEGLVGAGGHLVDWLGKGW